MAASNPPPSGAGAAVASRQPVAAGEGRPLPDPIRHRMETAFGADFSAVRVHEGHQATMAGARAYTQGDTIFFAPGAFDPSSQAGREILGHELAHVVQQRAGRVVGANINDNAALEREADQWGARVAGQGGPQAQS